MRCYERRGVLPRPDCTATGDRTCTSATVERLVVARELQQLGLTLDEVIEALHTVDRGNESCKSVRWRLEVVLQRIDARIDKLEQRKNRVRSVMDECEKGRCVVAGNDVVTAGR